MGIRRNEFWNLRSCEALDSVRLFYKKKTVIVDTGIRTEIIQNIYNL